MFLLVPYLSLWARPAPQDFENWAAPGVAPYGYVDRMLVFHHIQASRKRKPPEAGLLKAGVGGRRVLPKGAWG